MSSDNYNVSDITFKIEGRLHNSLVLISLFYSNIFNVMFAKGALIEIGTLQC